MMSQNHTPTDIDLDLQAQRVTIIWPDGLECRYSFEQLRQNCPCAACNDVRQKANEDPLFVFNTNMSQPTSDLNPDNPVELVGQYALQFSWADGHNTGIFTFPFLRKMAEEKKL